MGGPTAVWAYSSITKEMDQDQMSPPNYYDLQTYSPLWHWSYLAFEGVFIWILCKRVQTGEVMWRTRNFLGKK